jgi:hypothetical protein
MRDSPGRLIALLLFVLIAGCSSTKTIESYGYSKPIAVNPTVLLMSADVEVGALTAAGFVEPKAVWTQQAQDNVNAVLRSIIEAQGGALVIYDPGSLSPQQETRHKELIRLYDVVGNAMLTRRALPTASAKTDWTLGPGVRDLRADVPADYALFVFLRDQHATAGRVAMEVAVALLGGYTRSAIQYGHAGLVDLQTGDVMWFNQMIRGVGDLRERAPATNAVEILLEDCPIL